MQAAQPSKLRLSKGAILRVVLALYILLSAAYILFTQFQSYQTRVMQEAYMNGRVATIEELLDEAEAGCQPFPIYIEDRQVELINMSCLVPAAEAGTDTPIPLAPGSE